MTWPVRIELQLAVALALLGVIVVLLGPGVARSDAAECTNSSAPAYKLAEGDARKATLCLLNRERAAHGLRPLRADDEQQEAAEGHNRTMIRKRCFSHQCSGERDLVGRIEATGYLPCNCSWSVGENIAWGSGSTSSPRKIVAAWMHSAEHRANILNPRFEHAGVAVGQGSPAGGGDTATYTLDFGFKD